MGYDEDARQYMDQLNEGMTTAHKVTDLRTQVTEMATSTKALATANSIIDVIRKWPTFTAGAKIIANHLQVPEAYVIKVMKVLERQDVLKEQAKGVFRILPAFKDVEGIRSDGKLKFARSHGSGGWGLDRPLHNPTADPFAARAGLSGGRGIR